MSALPTFVLTELQLEKLGARLEREGITMECTRPQQLNRTQTAYHREWLFLNREKVQVIGWDTKDLTGPDLKLEMGTRNRDEVALVLTISSLLEILGARRLDRGMKEDLGGKLLENVSRSFYLTLKALPQGLREPISLAYLLARAADTLADTPNIAESIKQACLAEFDRLVQSEARDEASERALCERLRREFVPLQEDTSEARLLERLPEAFEAYRKSPARLMEATRGVLDPIVKGQLMDIQRFPVDGQLRSLTTEDELDEYTYLVAGCVGGFWTKLCASELESAIDPKVSFDDMLVWGIRYGKGLQLVNILRDIAKDIRMGRCYFPSEELTAHGLTLEMVQADPAKLIPVMAPWRERCREHLECGIQYLDALQHKRLRFATALPLLLGIRTLALINSADEPTLLQGVKVSRGEVAKILLEAGIANLKQGGLRKMGEKLMREV